MIRLTQITVLVLLLVFIGNKVRAGIYFSKADSISEAIKHADPHEKAVLFIEMAILKDEDAVISINYADSALILAKKHHFSHEMALALKAKGLGFNKLGETDSALAILKQSFELFNKNNDLRSAANVLNNIGIIYSDRSDFEQSIYYHQQELKLEKEIDDSSGITIAIYNIAITYDLWEKYDSAIIYYNRALKLAELIQDKEGEASALNSLGTIYLSWGNYQLALQYFLRSMKIYENMGDSLGISQALNNQGIIQFDFGDLEKSLAFYKRSFLIDSLTNDRQGQAQTLNNIAIIYDEMGQRDKALSVYKQSLEYAKQSEDYYQMAVCSGNLGGFYLEEDNFSEAEKYFDDTYKYYQAANSIVGIAEANILRGEFYFKKADYEQALKYYTMGLEIVQPMNLTEIILNAYAGLKDVHYAMGDYEAAYGLMNAYHQLSDSIFNIKTSKQLALTQQGYEIQKKDQEMELQDIKLNEQKTRIKRQKNLVILLFCTIGIVLIFTFLLIRQYNLRMKAWKQLLRQHEEILKKRQELILAKEKAEESDRLKTSFLKNFSHEIRTPLNGIIGFTDLLRKGNFSLQEQNNYLKYIESSGNQLLMIVNDIIDMASIETGQIELSEDTFNLHEILSDLLVEFQKELVLRENYDVKLILIPAQAPEDVMLVADKKRLQQIISNLISNAIRFTQEGQVSFGFKLVDDKFIQIFVKDTGIGIERSKFEMIFDRFRQVDESASRQQGGSGLGLAICKELLNLMGGRIYLESTLSKGSTFFVELPYLPGR